MIEVKQSVARWLPVRIFNSTGDPVAGVLYSAITASVMKADHTITSFSVASGDWFEATTSSFNASGTYMIQIPASVLDQPGPLEYAISTASYKVFIGAVKVVANEEVDTYSRIGAPAGASISADIASVKTDTTNIGTISSNLLRALGLMHENSVLDQTVYNVSNKITSGRLRIYDSKTDALAAGATGLLATYTISATYVGENVQTYTVVKE